MAKFKTYAWVLMDNHYHWVLETPHANLVEGMTWFQNAFTRRINAPNKLGTAEFVNGVFERKQALRNRFGEERSSKARRMRGAGRGELRVLHDLQKDVIGA